MSDLLLDEYPVCFCHILTDNSYTYFHLFREFEKRSEKNEGEGNWKRNAYGKKKKEREEKKKNVREKKQKNKRKLLRKK